MAVYNATEISSLSTWLFFPYNRSSSEDDVNGRQMKIKQNRVFKNSLLDAWKLASNQYEISSYE